jgi:hypothetical protein
MKTKIKLIPSNAFIQGLAVNAHHFSFNFKPQGTYYTRVHSNVVGFTVVRRVVNETANRRISEVEFIISMCFFLIGRVFGGRRVQLCGLSASTVSVWRWQGTLRVESLAFIDDF